MKAFVAVFVALVLAVPFVGAAGNDEARDLLGSELFRQSLAVFEQETGVPVDLGMMRVLAQQAFQLAPGVIGAAASFDHVTGALDVAPISFQPVTVWAPPSQSGCSLPGGFASGYEDSPTTVGPLCLGTTGPFLGPVTRQQLACTTNQACSTYAYANNGFFQVYCQFNTVATSADMHWGSGLTATGSGACSVAAFAAGPLATYDAFVSQSPSTGTATSATN